MKSSDSPVHDCIKENHETFAKEDVDFQEMDYIKTAIGALSTRCIKTIVGFYNVPDTDTDTDTDNKNITHN
jgi:hypothetical protein